MLALALLLVAPPKYDVAFVARIYYRYPDKRISREQVYVCDITGKHRKQLTTTASDPDAVRWVSPTKLSWAEWTEKESRLVLYDLTTDKAVTLIRTKAPKTIERVDFSPVEHRAIYLMDGKQAMVEPNGSLSWSSIDSVDVAGGLTSKRKWTIEGQSDVEHVGWVAPGGKVVSEPPTGEDFVTRVLKQGDMEAQVVLPAAASFVELFPGASSKSVWVRAYEGGASAGSNNTLSQIDWSTGKSRTVLSDLIGVMLSSNERYWVGLEPWRKMSKYGPRGTVWTKSAYAGDLQTGKRWTIGTGLINVTDIALRPEMK